MVWHNSVFVFFFPWGRGGTHNTKPELLSLRCHSWLPINLHSRYSDDGTCPAAKSDWVEFFSSVSYQEKKVSLWWGLSAHDCTTVINQIWQQWLRLYKSETGRFHNQNHPVSIRVSSQVMFFHLFPFSPIFN